jgi:hypothetical protein
MLRRFSPLNSRKPQPPLPEQGAIEDPEKDRRSAARYPLELRLRFRGLGRKPGCNGIGRSMNISSRGIWVWPASDAAVELGSTLETVLEWPVLLDDAVCLHLVTVGRVVRSDVRGFAVEIKRHTFRTAKRYKGSIGRLLLEDLFSV